MTKKQITSTNGKVSKVWKTYFFGKWHSLAMILKPTFSNIDFSCLKTVTSAYKINIRKGGLSPKEQFSPNFNSISHFGCSWAIFKKINFCDFGHFWSKFARGTNFRVLVKCGVEVFETKQIFLWYKTRILTGSTQNRAPNPIFEIGRASCRERV